jgi:SAM-dependent methyltransferase
MKTNQEWKQGGERDPLFGVISWKGRETAGANPWNDADFYALGDDWVEFERHWSRYGLRKGTVLEIGCGAGRMTNRLADDFEHVLACDVAEGMLAYAKPRVRKQNIDWRLSDGSRLPAEDASADAVFSCHVFQHLPDNAAQLSVFRDIHRVLRTDGTFLIHIPIRALGFGRVVSTWLQIGLLLHRPYAALRRGLAIMLARFGGQPPMNMFWYDIEQLERDLRSAGFQDVEFAWFKVAPGGMLHSSVMGRKP